MYSARRWSSSTTNCRQSFWPACAAFTSAILVCGFCGGTYLVGCTGFGAHDRVSLCRCAYERETSAIAAPANNAMSLPCISVPLGENVRRFYHNGCDRPRKQQGNPGME